MTDENLPIPAVNAEIIEASGVDSLLAQVRPQWRAKNLIERVNRLLRVDPSSACQRIFNAAIHDLKEKIVLAGLDIAKSVARQHKLPPVEKNEDVENYRVMNTIHLAYRMGLLSRPEWRRILRTYDIRRDLEHEDDEYEATVEDCVYMFKTSVEIVLARDPVHLIKLTDVKEIVERPDPVAPTQPLLEDYQHAPQPRQLEIYRFLLSGALNPDHADIVRQNCYRLLDQLHPLTDRQVLLDCARGFVERLGRKAPTMLEARVAYAAGILPYLKKSMQSELFSSYLALMRKVGYDFRSHARHGELLRNLQEFGGLDHCPSDLLPSFVEWLALCYIGEESFGRYTNSRKVFYSNVGAPLARQILVSCTSDLKQQLEDLEKTSRPVQIECRDEHVARRLQDLVDAT